MRDKKGTADINVPGDVLRLMVKDGLRIMTQLIINRLESGKWPKDFTEVAFIALKKKTDATKCSQRGTMSLIRHTAKIVANIPKRRRNRKIAEYLGNIILDSEEQQELGMQLGC
jgi:hypothetical protein